VNAKLRARQMIVTIRQFSREMISNFIKGILQQLARGHLARLRLRMQMLFSGIGKTRNSLAEDCHSCELSAAFREAILETAKEFKFGATPQTRRAPPVEGQ
jgi:hypothetical protein